jgi:hypothetical protein
MMLVAKALSNKEVGRRLELSEGTVKIHLHNTDGRDWIAQHGAKELPIVAVVESGLFT